MKVYTIIGGNGFVLSDGTKLGVGQTIELEDDVAAMHADKLQPVQTSEEPPAPAPAEG